MKKTTILSTALATIMMLGTTTPTFAAGNGQNVDVTIDAKATTVNVTISDTAPFIFNEDGTNTTPSNFTVKNNSQIAGLHLVSADFNQVQENGWTIENNNYSFKTMPKNTKKVAFKLGENGNLKEVVKSDVGKKGTATFGATDFAIPANETKTVKFEVTRGAFTTPEAQQSAFKLVMNFDFN